MSTSDEMEEVIVEFLVESKEGLDRVDDDLLALEKDPQNPARLASIFRAVHTIKGTAGFLAYEKLQAFAHVGESLLSLLRDGERPFDGEVAEALFAAVDALREMLGHIEAKRVEADKDYGELLRRMAELTVATAGVVLPEGGGAGAPAGLAGGTTPAPTSTPTSTLAPGTPAFAAPLAADTPGGTTAPARTTSSPSPSLSLTSSLAPTVLTPVVPSRQPPRAPTAESLAPAPPGSAAPQPEPTPAPASVQPTVTATAAPVAPPEPLEPPPELDVPRNGEAGVTRPGGGGESVRVDVSLLDRLMNLVGELVLARNQVLQVGSKQQDQAFLATSQRLNLITSELQESVMRTRMQPIGNVLHKFPRLVRDLAAACHKRVRVEMEGEKTELDRTLLEAIRDPLTHIVRNSVDHGIEPPAAREARGKNPEGRLSIRAFHEGGQVTVEVADDGGGINSVRVKDKALARGLITAEHAERMSESDLVNLIFLPGFSTAESVSNISGRGVGMDVVRTNVEKVGGTVDVQSVMGKGLTIRIRLPLTLAIIPALLVGNGEERYAIPQISLMEIVRLEREQVKRSIEIVHSTPVYRLRGNLLPLLFLQDALADDNGPPPSHWAEGTGPLNIVVLSTEDRVFGLVVDRVMDTSEIVVKPLGKHFKSVSFFAGATIMGDGSVSLILDAAGLANDLQGFARVREASAVALATGAGVTVGAGMSLLVCDVGQGRRLGIPLASVDRLEEFSRDRLERLGDQAVVQYRGDILRVFSLGELVGMAPGQASEEDEEAARKSTVQVVVCRGKSRRIGLQVNRILDVVEGVPAPSAGTARAGTLGSVVVGGRLIEVVDLREWTDAGTSAGGLELGAGVDLGAGPAAAVALEMGGAP
jgi:two-component system, chemotaxis family, sensor kinase CheA